MSDSIYNVFAPAKINLFLHILGQRKDGYHKIQSLVTFADIGDLIEIEDADHFSFELDGPFAAKFDKQSGYSDDRNLVVKAARMLAQIAEKPLKFKIRLTKNLPLSSGLGGGSSDAAACIWALQHYWSLRRDEAYLDPLLLKLGADVPVCYSCRPTVMCGIGEQLSPAPVMPEIPILIVNPNRACSTAQVFSHHQKLYSEPVLLPKHFPDLYALVDFLNMTNNDLYLPALEVVPEIGNVLHSLEGQEGMVFKRMSGSGASCFALFETRKQCEHAADTIKSDNPDWHIFTATLNSPERY